MIEQIFTEVFYLTYVWFDLLMVAYGYYLIVLIQKKTGRFSGRMLWIMWGMCALYFVFLTVGVLTGRMYAVENEQIIPENDRIASMGYGTGKDRRS